MRITTYIVIVLFLAWLPLTARAQQQTIRFAHFTVEQGLTSNTVTTILQDSRGFLWYATSDGLSRFDGYRFKPYKNVPLDTTSLGHNWIDAIFEDAAGVLWFGTNNADINTFNRTSSAFTHLQP